MSDRLTEICSELKIPEKSINWDTYRDTNRSETNVINAMIYIDKLLKGNTIAMGGMCANSYLLGYRKMRTASNDLDCVLTDEKFVYFLNSSFKGNLFKTKDFGDLFLDYNGIPVGFDLYDTHGWVIPQEFFDDAIRFNFSYGGLNSISPEFLISLKARRSISKERFYGKDALDTANILLAPHYKSNLKKVNYNKLASLIQTHACSSINTVMNYIDFIAAKAINLKREEIPILNQCLQDLKEEIKLFY